MSAENGWLAKRKTFPGPTTHIAVEMKRYGSLFTCLSRRTIHIESTNSLSTDAFIQALRRFVSRKDNVWLIWSANSTNFSGASEELNKAF